MVIKQTILKYGHKRHQSMETFDALTLLEALTVEKRFQIEMDQILTLSKFIDPSLMDENDQELVL